jgi:hypothetical protein
MLTKARLIFTPIQHRITQWTNRFGLKFVFIAGGVMLAIALAIQVANMLLLPIRVYLTGTETATVVESCRCKEIATEQPMGIVDYCVVRAKGLSEYVPIKSCEPKTSGEAVTVIDSTVAGKRVAVMGKAKLARMYLGMYGSAGPSLLMVILVGCGVTLYRVRTILRFAIAELRFAWAPLKFSKAERLRSFVKASEALTDFLFLGLIIGATGVISYAMFRALLYLRHGAILFSALAIASLTIVWSPAPLKVITYVWKAYKSPPVVILRNLVSGLLMVGAIRVIAQLPRDADFASIQGIAILVLAVLKASIGLDVK